MATARRGRHSLPELRRHEREILREWAQSQGRIFKEDPILRLSRHQTHGEHTVGFDPISGCWWKSSHPGKCGVGADFEYDLIPPFSILGISARELLPSEYIDRLILHNHEFGDDIRLEGYIDGSQPCILISQPDISGSPATRQEMESQMILIGYLPLVGIQLGKSGSISFYNPDRRIALFDAHPGNFFRTGEMVIPVDGIVMSISAPSEHEWLMDRTSHAH